MKIKRIACGNGYESKASKNGEFDTEKEYQTIDTLLFAITPKH